MNLVALFNRCKFYLTGKRPELVPVLSRVDRMVAILSPMMDLDIGKATFDDKCFAGVVLRFVRSDKDTVVLLNLLLHGESWLYRLRMTTYVVVIAFLAFWPVTSPSSTTSMAPTSTPTVQSQAENAKWIVTLIALLREYGLAILVIVVSSLMHSVAKPVLCFFARRLPEEEPLSVFSIIFDSLTLAKKHYNSSPGFDDCVRECGEALESSLTVLWDDILDKVEVDRLGLFASEAIKQRVDLSFSVYNDWTHLGWIMLLKAALATLAYSLTDLVSPTAKNGRWYHATVHGVCFAIFELVVLLYWFSGTKYCYRLCVFHDALAALHAKGVLMEDAGDRLACHNSWLGKEKSVARQAVDRANAAVIEARQVDAKTHGAKAKAPAKAGSLTAAKSLALADARLRACDPTYVGIDLSTALSFSGSSSASGVARTAVEDPRVKLLPGRDSV